MNVNATIPGTDVQATLEIERAAGLSDEKMQYWKNWICDGAVLTPVESTPASVSESPDSDAEIEFTETEESSDFETSDEESEDDGGGFDFAALAEGDSEQDGDQEDATGGFAGLVTDESESHGEVGTDDSDLADFLNDLQ